MTEIILSNGVHVPADPGRYKVDSPPDLNQVDSELLLLEYDFPFVVIEEVAEGPSSSTEKTVALFNFSSYQFNKFSSGYHQQFIPYLSYIDERTWSNLSAKDRNTAYTPCLPAVVIQIMNPRVDNMEDVQRKVAKFIDAGTKKAVIVDTRQESVWIHNRGEVPHFDALLPIEFDSCPEFTLEPDKIRSARQKQGLMY